MNKAIVPSLRTVTFRSNNFLTPQRFTSIRSLATKNSSSKPSSSNPPRHRRPHTPPQPQSLKDRFSNISKTWTKLNEHPRFRAGASVFLIVLYASAAYAGMQYLVDTKYKATGEKNPYKKREEAEKERLESSVIGEIGASSESSGNTSSSTSPGSDNALIPAPRDTTEIFDNLATEYDDKIWFEELTTHIWYRRRQLMKHVFGDVLEASCGTGRNITYFDPSPDSKNPVTSITFMDSSLAMLQIAREKFTKKFPTYEHVQYVKGKVEDLSEMGKKSGQKFDTIYETFGLCSHEDPVAALHNFEKLLRRNGRIVLLEHGRSYYRTLNETMDKKAEKRVEEWGCRWNLDIEDIVKRSGLEVVESDRYHFGSTYFYVLKRKNDE